MVSASTSMIMAWTPLAVAPPAGPKYLVDFKAGLGAGLHRAAHRIGLDGELAEAHRLAGDADDRHRAIGDHEVLLGAFEVLRGEPQDLLAHRPAGLVDGGPRHHRTAARKGAGAPVELVGIAGDDIDIANVDADLVGRDLGEAGEMPLPLGADSGGDADLAARLHLHLGALIGADAGALHIAGHADADAAALRREPRLLVPEEVVIADEFQGHAPGSGRNCRCHRRAGRSPGR